MDTEIKTKIRQFLNKHFKNHTFKDDEDIFSLGFVTSVFSIQLVMFVEETFNIKFDDKDLKVDNFRTITILTDLIKRIQQEGL